MIQKSLLQNSKCSWVNTWNSGWDCFTIWDLCFNCPYHCLLHICVYLSQYLEIFDKLFCVIHCRYYGMFSMHVPQGFKCGVFVMRVNLFKHQIGSFTPNIIGGVVNYFCQLPYIWDYVILPVLTFLSVGTHLMVDPIFDTMFWHRYGYSDWHSHNFRILIWYSESPQNLWPDDI